MINKKLGLKVKIERIKKNLSQEKLAELADIDRGTLSKIERGVISPTIATLYKLSTAFKIKISDLVDIDETD